MSAVTTASRDAPPVVRTLVDTVDDACARHAEAPALRYKDGGGRWCEVSYASLHARVVRLALGLEHVGARRGDRIAILASTRPEWTYFNLAATCLGAITVPIYPTSSAEECRHILADSGPAIVVFETREHRQRLEQILPALEPRPRLVSLESDPLPHAEESPAGRRPPRLRGGGAPGDRALPPPPRPTRPPPGGLD